MRKKKSGDITESGNFMLDRKITSLDEFWEVINRDESMFGRHKMYPTAFFFSWNIRTIQEWITKEYFWTTIKNNNNA